MKSEMLNYMPKRISDNLIKIFSLLVIFLPFTYLFKGISSVISFGELLLIPVIVHILIMHISDGKLVINKQYMNFYIIVVLITFICAFFAYFNINNTLTLILRLIFYAILVFEARLYFSYKAVRKVYKLFVTLMAVYVILQFI